MKIFTAILIMMCFGLTACHSGYSGYSYRYETVRYYPTYYPTSSTFYYYSGPAYFSPRYGYPSYSYPYCPPRYYHRH